MSIDLLATRLPRQPFDQLEFRSKLPFHLRVGDGRTLLTDDGAAADLTTITDRTGRVGTFTRGGAPTGTVVSSNGHLVSGFTNFPNLEYWDHDGDDIRETAGLRMDMARTNLVLRSEEFDNASWTKTDTTITANLGLSPDGKRTADLFTEGSAGTAITYQAVTVASGAVVAASCHFKRGSHDWVRFGCVNGSEQFQSWINLSTGAVGTLNASAGATIARAYVETLPDGFYRFVVVGTLTGITSYTVFACSASADNSSTRVNNATRYQWGAQAEEGARWASSYIPTTSATLARSKDDLRFPFPYQVQALSLYLKFTELGTRYATDVAATGVLVALMDGTGGADPKLYIAGHAGIGGYFVDWDPGAPTTAGLAAYPALGQQNELLVTISDLGVPTITQSIAGAATTTATGSAQPLPTGGTFWGSSEANARLVIGSYGVAGTNPAALSLHVLKVDWGVKTMEQMRRSS